MSEWKLLQRDVEHTAIASDMGEVVECYNITE